MNPVIMIFKGYEAISSSTDFARWAILYLHALLNTYTYNFQLQGKQIYF